VDAAAKALELLSVFSFREPACRSPTWRSAPASRAPPPSACCRRSNNPDFSPKSTAPISSGSSASSSATSSPAGWISAETAHPHLVALRDTTRETTQIAILDHWQVVYLERVLSPLPAGFMRARSGAILPAYCTGLGKTLLAFRPEAEVAAWAATQKFTG
jgi:hypothetical protein